MMRKNYEGDCTAHMLSMDIRLLLTSADAMHSPCRTKKDSAELEE